MQLAAAAVLLPVLLVLAVWCAVSEGLDYILPCWLGIDGPTVFGVDWMALVIDEPPCPYPLGAGGAPSQLAGSPVGEEVLGGWPRGDTRGDTLPFRLGFPSRVVMIAWAQPNH